MKEDVYSRWYPNGYPSPHERGATSYVEELVKDGEWWVVAIGSEFEAAGKGEMVVLAPGETLYPINRRDEALAAFWSYGSRDVEIFHAVMAAPPEWADSTWSRRDLRVLLYSAPPTQEEIAVRKQKLCAGCVWLKAIEKIEDAYHRQD